MLRFVLPLVVVALAGGAFAGPFENGLKDTPGKRLPPGDYSCSMGSYAARPCTVSLRDERFFLTVSAGARFLFELELQG